MVSANVLILLELIDDMDLPTIKSYMCYTAKIGNYMYLQMKLDEVHHKAVVDGAAESWDKIDSDDVYFHFKEETR